MRPIDADALSKAIEEAFRKAEDEGWKPGDVARVLCAIIAAPTLDLEPVRHGFWVRGCDDADCEFITCSICGSEFYDGDNDTYDITPRFCCNCGSKMDLSAPQEQK